MNRGDCCQDRLVGATIEMIGRNIKYGMTELGTITEEMVKKNEWIVFRVPDSYRWSSPDGFKIFQSNKKVMNFCGFEAYYNKD